MFIRFTLETDHVLNIIKNLNIIYFKQLNLLHCKLLCF